MAIASITAGGETSIPVRLQGGIRTDQSISSSKDTLPAYSVSVDSRGRPTNPFLATLVEKEKLDLIESKKQVPDPAIFDKNDDGKSDISDVVYDSAIFNSALFVDETEAPHALLSSKEALDAYTKAGESVATGGEDFEEAQTATANDLSYIV